MRPRCFPAVLLSGRRTTRWRFASLLAMNIPITTRLPHFASASLGKSRRCSSKCCSWRARWGCSSSAPWPSMARKIHAGASRHSAPSYGHAKKIEKQLKKEVQQLLRPAEKADENDIPDGMSIPEELERRELRLAAIAEAKAKIEARADER